MVGTASPWRHAGQPCASPPALRSQAETKAGEPACASSARASRRAVQRPGRPGRPAGARPLLSLSCDARCIPGLSAAGRAGSSQGVVRHPPGRRRLARPMQCTVGIGEWDRGTGHETDPRRAGAPPAERHPAGFPGNDLRHRPGPGPRLHRRRRPPSPAHASRRMAPAGAARPPAPPGAFDAPAARHLTRQHPRCGSRPGARATRAARDPRRPRARRGPAPFPSCRSRADRGGARVQPCHTRRRRSVTAASVTAVMNPDDDRLR